MKEKRSRIFRVREPSQVPWDAVILGWGPIAPFPLAAFWLWLGGPDQLKPAMQLWGASIALFLSGVRRGLSFRMPDGWTWSQLAVFAWLFWAGFVSLIVSAKPAFVLLALVYASLAILDPAAAGRKEVPLWFRGLRPAQMTVASLGLAWLWWLA